jgi:hypothetical protein
MKLRRIVIIAATVVGTILVLVGTYQGFVLQAEMSAQGMMLIPPY